jgi:hypothetical protein
LPSVLEQAGRKNALWLAVAFGLLYGLFMRVSFTFKFAQSWVSVMSLSFVTLVPFCLGLICVMVAERGGRRGARIWLLLPWAPAGAAIVAALLLFWEGIICAVFMLPAALICASLGGLAGALVARKSRQSSTVVMLCCVALPFLTGPLEKRLTPPHVVRAVHTQIEIAASPETVWTNIKRVPPIAREEEKFSWSQAIGFPAPIEATLSKEAAGGIRHASFARGVMFIETVQVWEPQHRLMFGIHADPATIPPTALDEHVTVGGPYFDVLEGEYRIESAGPGHVMLHLTSRHRLSTTFNFYASFWSDRVMRDVQENILWVIKNRCERR